MRLLSTSDGCGQLSLSMPKICVQDDVIWEYRVSRMKLRWCVSKRAEDVDDPAAATTDEERVLHVVWIEIKLCVYRTQVGWYVIRTLC